ncbi:MAG TPA: SDR family oxidoreductase [Streptosporangiaceae bacterium]|nr:SDR family oxidoreductase [Streptosporangiaceae bacterium]
MSRLRRAVPSAAASVRGKTVVVTGAARGLGAAVAQRLASRGANLALVGLEPAELEETAARCRTQMGAEATARTWDADVTDHDRMRAVAAEVAETFGHVDVVVANAGIAIGGPYASSDPAAFHRVIEVNLVGSAVTARAFLPALLAVQGYFLQVASLAAVVPAPLMSAYCASKAGVEAFARVLHTEVAHRGVDVGVAYLSWTDTDMVRASDADDVLRQLRARLPGPAGKTAPLGPAADRLAAGIARRSASVYGQPWIRLVQWLPRSAIGAAVGPRGSREVARIDEYLQATADTRLLPLGPGGRAATEAPRQATKTGSQ